MLLLGQIEKYSENKDSKKKMGSVQSGKTKKEEMKAKENKDVGNVFSVCLCINCISSRICQQCIRVWDAS